MGQDKDNCRVNGESQVRRDGGQEKGGKKHKGEEGDDRICLGYGGEEEVLNSIQIWVVKRDEYLFANCNIG